VHFTREPIIESILSARDGYKLVLKSSKNPSSAEVSAEVLEIVSFSGAVFYRSQDRSKNFLLPATDYEVVEVKDARLVLKNISLEKSSKLQNPPKEHVHHEADLDGSEEALSSPSEDSEAPQVATSQPSNSRLERRRERRRNRRRRHNEERAQHEKVENTENTAAESSDVVQDTDESSQAPIPTINLIPPPTTLISQTLARYKDKPQDSTPVDAGAIIVEDNTTTTSLELPLEPEDLV